MLQRADRQGATVTAQTSVWRRFVALLVGVFAAGLIAGYAFVLLVDPYHLMPFSLPIDRAIVSGNQRYVYPQVIRSRRYDGLIIGTSSARLIDPERLNAAFGVRFANLSMNAATPWEEMTLFRYFLRNAGPPKALIVAMEGWCRPDADRERITKTHGFPDWLWDDNRWNDLPYIFNSEAVILAARLVRYQFGLGRAVMRRDGFEVFTPPEASYSLAQARGHIWRGRMPERPPDVPPPVLLEAERRALTFPALAWLDDMLAQLPEASVKVLAHMPLHVADQPWPGTHRAAVAAECKARIAELARARGAKVLDWGIASPITTDDANYWDPLHYRLPIADRIAEGLIAGVLHGKEPADGSYRLVVR
jgi:hypothetical protein